VKWLHASNSTDQPYMARDETSKYSDLMPDGKARIFTYAMEAKVGHHVSVRRATLSTRRSVRTDRNSLVRTRAIERVEVTTNGGRTWVKAELQEPRLPIALTRFRLAWRFDGQDTVIASRAVDETATSSRRARP